MKEPLELHKRNTGITCEWRYPWNDTAVCGLELTPREVKYCDKNIDELDGKHLCYAHQRQFIDKKKQEGKRDKTNLTR